MTCVFSAQLSMLTGTESFANLAWVSLGVVHLSGMASDSLSKRIPHPTQETSEIQGLAYMIMD